MEDSISLASCGVFKVALAFEYSHTVSHILIAVIKAVDFIIYIIPSYLTVLIGLYFKTIGSDHFLLGL